MLDYTGSTRGTTNTTFQYNDTLRIRVEEYRMSEVNFQNNLIRIDTSSGRSTYFSLNQNLLNAPSNNASTNPPPINNNFSQETPTPAIENQTNQLFKMQISYLLN